MCVLLTSGNELNLTVLTGNKKERLDFLAYEMGWSSVTHLDKRKMFVYIMWKCEFNKVGSLAFIVSLHY